MTLARWTLPWTLLSTLACGEATPAPEPLRIAVLMPVPVASATDGLPTLEWALEAINAAGGVAGRPLALEYVDPASDEITALGEQLANDERYVAVIGPPGSAALQSVAPAFVAASKPIVSTTSTSDDLLRAYGGKGAIWRTRESDIAQTELLVRFARDSGGQRIALLSSLAVGGHSFFAWFGFFASELGFAEDQVEIVALPDDAPCQAAVMEAVESGAEILFVAAETPEQLDCVVRSLPPMNQPRPRVILADTGLDPYQLEGLGAAAHGIEGFVGASDPAFASAFAARFPGQRLAPHAASEYDALLLLAYGLELSEGAGGKPLLAAMQEAVDGTEASARSWDAEGIAGTLDALRASDRPQLYGATGPLSFEPGLAMDLASYTYSHWQLGAGGLEFGERIWTGDPSFLASSGAFVRPALGPRGVDASSWKPATAKAETWAVIAALSSGWQNYRHQADALAQYRLLRARGVADDHIVLILADDLASADQNLLRGEIRNAPAGPDLYPDAVIDYDLSLTADELVDIITGQANAQTPTVISPGAADNVYIYLVGHGGTEGMPLGAASTADGLAGGDASFTPTHLREAMCALRGSERLRRGLVVIESCFGGVFGEAEFAGLERGCGSAGAETPLAGVVLLTAANSREVSYAGAYDGEVPAWVNDAFSRELVVNAADAPDISLADLYTDVYRGTAGSHASIYNTDEAGRLSAVSFAEFIAP